MNSLVKDIQDQYKDILLAPVSALKFTVRTENCLATENIKYVADLVRRREVELLRIDGFGNKSINEVKEVLANCNLSLGTELAARFSHELGVPNMDEKLKMTITHSLNYALRAAADKVHANCVSNDPDKAQVYVSIISDILYLLGEELPKP